MTYKKTKYLICILAVPLFSGSLLANSITPEELARQWFQSYARGEIQEPNNLVDLSIPESSHTQATALNSEARLERVVFRPDTRKVKDTLDSVQCITGHSVAYCKPEGIREYLVVRRVHGQWKLEHPTRVETLAHVTGKKPARTQEHMEPEEVAGLWLIAIAGQDESTLQRISTSGSLQNTLQLAREGYKIQSPDQREKLVESAHQLSEIMECKTMQDRALCKPRGKTRWIHLSKVKGEWKVDFRGFVKYDKPYLSEATYSSPGQ
ncbi:MAG: hypothetical protein CMF59_00510 [Leptospiraceae bacterium]|nr:hypothetical protein [Leptospiraceae bacterium]